MIVKPVFVASALALVLVPGVAVAQSNPFLPPQGGLSKDQIQQIVRQEIERERSSNPSTPTKDPSKPSPSGSPGAVTSQMKSQVDSTPSQKGPSSSPSPAQSAEAASDPISDLLKDGGTFVGCVGETPVFQDKLGRRAYFTSKELRESNEARRFARCR